MCQECFERDNPETIQEMRARLRRKDARVQEFTELLTTIRAHVRTSSDEETLAAVYRLAEMLGVKW